MEGYTGQTIKLKYHPFPVDKKEIEYIIGEAFLRYKGVSERDLKTLENVDCEPPDVVVTIEGFGKLEIEVTNFTPHDRADIVHRQEFIESLRFYLSQFGTKAVKLSNIYVHKEGRLPKLRPQDVEKIARKIDRFLKQDEFAEKYHIIQDILKEPIGITFIPALGNHKHNLAAYENNILIKDITGIPITEETTNGYIGNIVKKKEHQTEFDILVIHQQILGLLSLEKLFNQIKELLLSHLAFKGIYIITLITEPIDYWVSLITIREHPKFQSKEQ